MGRLTARNVSAAMWRHRPVAPELLFWTVLALAAHLLIGLPLLLLVAAVALLLVAATLYVAIDDLTAMPAIEADPGKGGGRDAN